MDSNSKCFVMLSHNIKNVKSDILRGDWYISEKYDGVRAIWDTKNLLTRTQRKFSYVPEWFTKLLPTFPIEGEIIVPDKPFNYFSGISILKDYDPRWEDAVFVIFDTPRGDLPFHERLDIIKKYVYRTDHKSISLANFRLIPEVEKNMNTIHTEFSRVIKLGKEGLMMIRRDNKYQPRRVKTLLKYKKEYEGECVVIDYLEGTGKYKGILGKIRCKLPTGKIFNMGSGFLDVHRKCYIFENGEIKSIIQPDGYNVPVVGDTVTYSCMEINASGIPRTPIYKGIRYDCVSS